MISFLIPLNATFWKHNCMVASEAFKNVRQLSDKITLLKVFIYFNISFIIHFILLLLNKPWATNKSFQIACFLTSLPPRLQACGCLAGWYPLASGHPPYPSSWNSCLKEERHPWLLTLTPSSPSVFPCPFLPCLYVSSSHSQGCLHIWNLQVLIFVSKLDIVIEYILK